MRNSGAAIFACIACILLFACGLSDNGPVALGTLEWDRVELLAEVSEPVTAIYVDESEQVAAGQAILQLDARRTEALRAMEAGTTVEELQQAKSALAQAESAVKEFEISLGKLTVTAPVDGRLDSLPCMSWAHKFRRGRWRHLHWFL